MDGAAFSPSPAGYRAGVLPTSKGTNMSCTFSAHGARWTVWPFAPGLNEEVRTAREISAMTGLYFRATDGEERVLAMSPPEFAALGELTARTNQELAQLAAQAKVRS